MRSLSDEAAQDEFWRHRFGRNFKELKFSVNRLEQQMQEMQLLQKQLLQKLQPKE